MIVTGLTVAICGHLIGLDRDEANHFAQVTVTSLNGKPGRVALEAIRVAARLLAQRAARCLGHQWIIREWEG